MTAPPPTDPAPYGSVELDPGICPPDAPYPTSIEARIANDDPTQCSPIDPCMSDGTRLWTAMPCDPATVAVVAVSTPPLPAQLPATGLFEVGLVGAAVVSIGLGCLLRLVARDRRYRTVTSGS